MDDELIPLTDDEIELNGRPVVEVEGSEDSAEIDEPKTKKVPKNKRYKKNGKLRIHYYNKELRRLQEEFVKLQRWVTQNELKVCIVFEGRGSAGKGGIIKRIAERTNPRVVRTVALPKPSDREATQWYFQRYVFHLPAAGEIVMFDRSWYNRSNVEWVMGFADQEEVEEFLRSCPQFERMLVRAGVILLKYWFSVSYEEQRKRFMSRNLQPLKRWKLSDIDLAEHRLYDKFSQAKDMTFEYTDIKQAPWYVIPADDKRKARLNCMHHILSQINYKDMTRPPVELPEREKIPYIRPPMDEQTFIKEIY